MPECTSIAAPAWITKRDGRLVPFESEKISRSLFAATEELGKPDAVLARELTDQSLNYLIAQIGSTVPTTAEVADLVAKAVRDLGQQALAQKFSESVREHSHPHDYLQRPHLESTEPGLLDPLHRLLETAGSSVDAGSIPWAVGREFLRRFALREVFARDIGTAHRDSLLALGGLAVPFELSGGALGVLQPGERGVFESIERTRRDIGQFIAIDGPEYALAFTSGAHDECRADYVREVHIGLRATGLRAVINLNCASPPLWTRDLTEGPLFDEPARSARPEAVAEHADGLLEQFLRLSAQRLVRVDWHVARRDFTDIGRPRLLQVARRSVDEAALAFVFDRPRTPVNLAEGIDRQRPHVLLTIGMNLPELFGQSPAEMNESRFLRRLESLTRLAVSAGLQKREFLCRRTQSPEAGRGRLASARLLIVPLGLDAIVRRLTDRPLTDRGRGMDLGIGIVARMMSVLADEGERHHLPSGLDSATHFGTGVGSDHSMSDEPGDRWTSGLTSWDPEADPNHQLEAASVLHAKAGAGTTTLHISRQTTAEEVVSILRQALENTAIIRLRLVSQGPPARQLTAPWEQEP